MPIDSPPSRSSASQRDLHVGGTLGDVAALSPPASSDPLGPEKRKLPVVKLPASSDVPQCAPLSDWQLLGRNASIAGFVLVNLWLVYHLAGIVLAPWSVPPSSRLVQNAWRGIGPYVQILFLNHGYHYFAPEPGNSTLVAYVLELPGGKRETGKIPNRGIRPRLLYHRHFMLTEFLAASENYPPALRTELLRAMARELCHEHGALRVTLSKVSHRLPTMERIRAGGTLDDNYTEEPLGTFSCDGL